MRSARWRAATWTSTSAAAEGCRPEARRVGAPSTTSANVANTGDRATLCSRRKSLATGVYAAAIRLRTRPEHLGR